jgi:hypothetical protein
MTLIATLPGALPPEGSGYGQNGKANQLENVK